MKNNVLGISNGYPFPLVRDDFEYNVIKVELMLWGMVGEIIALLYRSRVRGVERGRRVAGPWTELGRCWHTKRTGGLP